MSRERPLHFLHIGKTGGTAVKHALKPVEVAENLILHPHPARLSDVSPGESVFFFLRDPMTRFISAFYSRRREGRPRYLMPWSPGEAAAFARFHTPDELANGLSSISAAERKKAVRAMSSIAHINTRFWSWLISPAYLQSRAADIFFIGMQEHLAGDFAIIRAQLGLAESVQLPNDDVDAHRNPSGLDRSLGEQAKRNLAAWYGDDFVAMRECRRIARERNLAGAIVDAAWLDFTPLASQPARKN
ncbi:MAG: sulfotransferase family 2 domain-containing protein [Betaproteobacteria bacterium]